MNIKIKDVWIVRKHIKMGLRLHVHFIHSLNVRTARIQLDQKYEKYSFDNFPTNKYEYFPRAEPDLA